MSCIWWQSTEVDVIFVSGTYNFFQKMCCKVGGAAQHPICSSSNWRSVQHLHLKKRVFAHRPTCSSSKLLIVQFTFCPSFCPSFFTGACLASNLLIVQLTFCPSFCPSFFTGACLASNWPSVQHYTKNNEIKFRMYAPGNLRLDDRQIGRWANWTMITDRGRPYTMFAKNGNFRTHRPLLSTFVNF